MFSLRHRARGIHMHGSKLVLTRTHATTQVCVHCQGLLAALSRPIGPRSAPLRPDTRRPPALATPLVEAEAAGERVREGEVLGVCLDGQK